MPDGHNAPRLIYEFVPRLAAEFDDIFVGSEHPVGEPVVAHELPDILNRVEFRTFGRKRDDADIAGLVAARCDCSSSDRNWKRRRRNKETSRKSKPKDGYDCHMSKVMIYIC